MRVMAARWYLANRDIVANAASLVGSAAVTSGLGFAFWLVGARLFAPESVGLASAAVAAMLMLSTIGVLGLDALVISEIGRHLGAGDRARAGRLVSAAVLGSFATSGGLGLAFALLAPALSANVAAFFAHPAAPALFALGVAATGATYVFDRATIGFLAGGIQLARNVWFSLLRLLLLPTVLWVPVAVPAELGIYGLGAIVTLVSLALVLPAALRLLPGRELAPDWGVLGRVGGSALRHHLLNVAQHGPGLAMPVLVVALFEPAVGAAFYVTWMLIVFAQSVPVHLTTVLHAVGAHDVGVLAEKVRTTLRLSLIAAAAVAVGTLVLGEPVLRLFGAHYADAAAGALRVLALTVAPAAIKVHYVALARVRGFTARAALVTGALGAVELIAVVWGARSGSLTVTSWWLLAALALEALLLAPVVLRAASVRVRSPRSGAVR